MEFLKLGMLIMAVVVAAVALLSFPSLERPWTLDKLLSGADSQFADLVLTDALIYTSDHSTPFAEAMAIRGERILQVGNFSSIQGLIGRKTQVLNLKGKVVLPGFIESHVHLISGGLQMVQVELNGVKDKHEFVQKVMKAARGIEKGSWILGGGWNNDLWGGDMPVASWIDDITPDNPVWLSRVDGHMGLANSFALREAGITKSTPEPVGGNIMRSSSGEPTGLLIDSAMELMLPLIPKASTHERRNAMVRASKYALLKGVTTVVDVGRYFPGAPGDLVWEDFRDVYEWAYSTGQMHIRVCLFFPLETWTRLVELMKNVGRALGNWIFLGGLKTFADGSLGSSSALLYKPYLDEPNNFGLEVTDHNWILNNTIEADKLGVQIAVHAIGDKANDLMLELNKVLVSTNGVRDRRFRIEHAQHLVPEATICFGEQSVIASVQPQHLLDDADAAIKKLGHDRALKESYLFQSLLKSNARLAFGSDWPVADINPLGAIKAAVSRTPPSWSHAWNPSECLTINDALNASTISAAYACFLDDQIGSLSPGKLADFVVLSTNSWRDFAEEVSASVVSTYVGGKLVYSEDWAGFYSA
ncbi:protein LONG AFTER FAR-RED 3 isoform X2 [Nymphaea colorata]|uniref:protein LONG AFTER FAR-RED 3 isoform X2 n=1 Tax=Nymphaea colorata TaxID=210225 RepID=UPI00129EEDEE|nr:protein LONG AFTER FAR-RED 3 isoform X2 [Nymphaea colorata]